MLTTINISHYSNTAAPATPFNIYAVEGDCGLSINLRDQVLNVPVSFYMSDLPYEPVTRLWFTGVNAISGQLVFYDALTGSGQRIIDGCYIDIPTPEFSHQVRYFIRRQGFNPDEPATDITTDAGLVTHNHASDDSSQPAKIISNGHVFILRNGRVYSVFGQLLQ